MNPALFITFEGIEGCGKSTQASMLADALRRLGVSVVLTREPGGTLIGDALRCVLLDPDNRAMSHEVELLLYSAARAQHVHEVIRPALAAGTWVVCDRFADSTRAYQGHGLGLAFDQIEFLERMAVAGTVPDVTFLLDLDPEVGLLRKFQEGKSTPDRIEERDLDFHRRVREGFRQIARNEPGRVVLLNALVPAEELHERIVSAPKIQASLSAAGVAGR